MAYHLIIQPFDSDFNFLEDMGNQAKVVYKPKIKTFEVLPKVKLPEHVLTFKEDYFSKCLIEDVILKLDGSAKEEIKKHYEAGEKMVYVEDIFNEMTNHWAFNSNEIFIGILSYFVFGLMDMPNGQAERDANMAIASTFGIKNHLSEVSIGIALHEIGHDLGLDHCKNKDCLMRKPSTFEDFYEGVYKLCEKHAKQISE